jgi:biopolymer transport protein ExbD
MAGSAYKDDDEAGITDINVTPFVDVVLVLLVVFMVTARLIVSHGVEVEPPSGSAGADVKSTLRVALKWSADGKPCEQSVNAIPFTSDEDGVALIRKIVAANSAANGKTKPKAKAIIAGDRRCVYDGVMHLIEVVKKADVTGIALENVVR